MSLAVSIIFPAFDEVGRIEPTLRAYAAWLLRERLAAEILVVDDGSTDGTADFVDGLGIPAVRVLRCPQNRGKGHAVRVGMLAASGAVRVFADADGSTGPEQLPALLGPLMRGTGQVAVGSRYVEGSVVEVRQPWHRWAWGRLVNRIVQLLLLPGLKDTQCGFKALTAEATEVLFPRCAVDGWSFDLELLALARARGFRVTEVPVVWADDDRSSVKRRHLWRSIRELVRIRRSVGVR